MLPLVTLEGLQFSPFQPLFGTLAISRCHFCFGVPPILIILLSSSVEYGFSVPKTNLLLQASLATSHVSRFVTISILTPFHVTCGWNFTHLTI